VALLSGFADTMRTAGVSVISTVDFVGSPAAVATRLAAALRPYVADPMASLPSASGTESRAVEKLLS